MGDGHQMKLCLNCGSPNQGSSEKCARCGAYTRKRTDKLLGTVLADKYRIEEHLGTGGMCDVYRARHTFIGKEVAVKVLKPELATDPQIASRFEQEARAASSVRHPNAIDVNDFGIAEGEIPFIVMELVEGETLGSLLRREGPMTVERAANIIRQVCGALEVAHSVGVIHRDIKPDNILISAYEGTDWAEVVDFGVAKIQEDVNRRAALTGANLIIGTPRYMSPEQCEERPVDARSDIYSLGVVVYEMLTGEAPFEGNSTRLLIAHSAEPPAPLRYKRPDLPAEIEDAVMRALEKDPARRPQRAAEFAQEFMRAAGIAQETMAEPARAAVLPRFDEPLDLDEQTLVRRPVPMDVDPILPHSPPSLETTYATYEDGAATEANIALAASSKAERQSSSISPFYALLAAVVLIAILTAYFVSGRLGVSNEQAVKQRPQEPAAPAGQTKPENATEGAESRPPEPDTTRAGSAAPQQQNAAEVNQEKVRNQVATTIDGWARALASRDLNAHISYYAPTLHTFYLTHGVNRGFVRTDRARALSQYTSLSFDFKNMDIRIDTSGKRAVATFDKSWNFGGRGNSAGTVRERLWLESIGGRWHITGERDLKVYDVTS
jgi:eukaryotic-like serine/threonine-protein kinase